MKLISILSFVMVVLFASCNKTEPKKYSGNPLFEEPLTADPCVLVYNDTLYLFTGSDEQVLGKDGFVMKKWYVFSTADMVNWTNHGVKLKIDDFEWAADNAFAGHVVENHGKFWWYAPLTHKSVKVHEGFAIGVAVADHPLGPWKDATGKPIIADTTKNSIVLNIDPAVFVDDDQQVYFIWGSWGAVRMAKLNSNMTELDGPVENIEGLTDFFEAPWVHKRNGIYYMSYAASYPSRTDYATSTSINGPWEYQGVLNDTITNSPTNHQAIVHFKGKDYFFYHNAGTSNGGPFRRSVCVDEVHYTEDGLMKQIVRTKTGVLQVD